MPSIYDLKPRFRLLLRPVVDLLSRRGVTPNQLTLGAMLMSAAGGAWMARGLWDGQPRVLLAAPLFLGVRMALNAMDGLMAEVHSQKSRLGALLNELGDVVSDAALYAPLLWIPRVPVGSVVALLVLSGATEFVGVLGAVLGSSRRYEGPMGKSDRAVVLGAWMFAVGLGVPAAAWMVIILRVVVVLLVVTVVNRAVAALESPPRTPGG